MDVLSEENKESLDDAEEEHEWNIEEITQEVVEQKPPNDKIVSYHVVKQKK